MHSKNDSSSANSTVCPGGCSLDITVLIESMTKFIYCLPCRLYGISTGHLSKLSETAVSRKVEPQYSEHLWTEGVHYSEMFVILKPIGNCM